MESKERTVRSNSQSQCVQAQLRTPEQGTDTILWLALMDNADLEAGALYLDRQTQHKHNFMSGTQYTQAESDKLWQKLETLTGLQPEPAAIEEAAAEQPDTEGAP